MDNPILKEVERQRERLDKISQMALDLPVDTFNSYWLSYDTICIRIPHALDSIRAFRKSLPKAWQPRSYKFATKMDDGGFCYQYVNAGIQMNVYTEMAQGQTCRRVQVGERMTPVYQIVCGKEG